jgi:hypothetical protein
MPWAVFFTPDQHEKQQQQQQQYTSQCTFALREKHEAKQVLNTEKWRFALQTVWANGRLWIVFN